MADYLADVEMPPNMEEEKATYPTGEPTENVDLVLTATSDTSEEEETIPIPEKPKPREKLKKEDIFKKRPPPEVPQTVPKIDPIVEPAPPLSPKVPKVRKKRVMTEKQLAALAKGREKSAATRKVKRDLINKLKEEKEKERDTKQSTHEDNKLFNNEAKQYGLAVAMNRKDIEEATEAAIEKYEAKRKARKEIKRKEQEKEKHDSKVFKDINNALTRQSDPWAYCFQ
jgi:protein-tyrosine-phosphatase